MQIITCCYGNNSISEKTEININEFPKYFSPETWEVIQQMNEQGALIDGKIVALIDTPVEYIAGLTDKNTQGQKIDNNFPIIAQPIYHGTGVASVIASTPCRLSCHNENYVTTKPCDKLMLVVAGIAQNIKLVNFPFTEKLSDINNVLQNLVVNVDQLIDEQKQDIQTSRKQIPTKVILNFSFAVDGIEEARKNDLQNMRIQLDTLSLQYPNNLEFQWGISYIDNMLSWSPPVAILSGQPALQKRWNNLQKLVDRLMMKHDTELELLEKAMKDNLLPRQDDFLVVMAAGNRGAELTSDNAGFLAKNLNMENDPIIAVAAGCGKDYIQLCDFSNFGSVVDILAPGEHIPVIYPVKSDDGKSTIGKATYVSGTSFSAPMVAGALTLLAQCNPTASVQDIKKALFESAYQVPELETRVANGRVLNIKGAVELMCERDPASHSEKPLNYINIVNSKTNKKFTTNGLDKLRDEL